ncbi:MAG: Rpn family recombination-promoting nuclease/putative transposase [Spirochaetaceae bacterium]|nr:Rpn family recombination-promoting nuclease/putative transposase [Spirochaetaceae bacterium]
MKATSNFLSEEEYLAQMKTGALLNPRIDSTFKALFTQPTEESRNALHSFLEAATERKIRSVELTANEAPEAFVGQRGVSYDILCIFDDGQPANLEMMAFNQKYDYGKRAEYQVARLETTYLRKGDTWEKAPKVYQITVLDFVYDKTSNEPVSRYAMRTKDNRTLSDNLNVIFIELPKAIGLEDRIGQNTALENWAIFLKDADNPEKTGVIKKLTEMEAGLMNAKQSLSSISENQDLWVAQYRQEIMERDYNSSMSAAKSEGIAIGEERGRSEAKLEAARNFLRENVPEEVIARCTGLPLDTVKQLSKN